MDLAKTQHCVHDERERIERWSLIESENEGNISYVIIQGAKFQLEVMEYRENKERGNNLRRLIMGAGRGHYM